MCSYSRLCLKYNIFVGNRFQNEITELRKCLKVANKVFYDAYNLAQFCRRETKFGKIKYFARKYRPCLEARIFVRKRFRY